MRNSGASRTRKVTVLLYLALEVAYQTLGSEPHFKKVIEVREHV